MFPAERLDKIKNLLYEKKHVDVQFLSSTLKVTEVTVRRDLEKLELEGFLLRTHGGAVLVDPAASSSPVSFPALENPAGTDAPLKMIGTLCGFFINDNDIIFLGPGISNRYMAKALQGKKNITVVTNDLAISLYVATLAPEVRIVCPGGELNPSDMQFYGRIAERTLRDLHFNSAFIDIDGISMEKGYTVSSLNKAYLVKDILEMSEQNIALCTSDRFNQNSFVPLGDLSMFKTVISNEETPTNYKEYYFKNNIQFFCTFDAYRG